MVLEVLMVPKASIIMPARDRKFSSTNMACSSGEEKLPAKSIRSGRTQTVQKAIPEKNRMGESVIYLPGGLRSLSYRAGNRDFQNWKILYG